MARFGSDRFVSPSGGASVELTGDAAVTDVLDGKFFYSNDANTKLEGTLVAVDVSDTTAIASVVNEGYYFYIADGTKTLGIQPTDKTASISLTVPNIPTVSIATVVADI